MELKKFSSLSTEDLLNQLENDKAPASSGRYKNEVSNFITDFSLESGKEEIPTKLLYKIYKQWSQEPVKYTVFSSILYYFFEKTKKYALNCVKLSVNTEILIDILDNIQKKKHNRANTFASKQQMDSFFKAYDIKPGRMYLEGFILYYLYDSWTYKTRKTRILSKMNFTKVLKVFFTYKLVGNNYHFRIDKSILQHLPKDVLTTIRSSKYATQKK